MVELSYILRHGFFEQKQEFRRYVEAVRGDSSFLERFAVNSQIVRNMYLCLPIAKDGHDECKQVGREIPVDKTWHGKPLSYHFCDDTLTHEAVGEFGGEDFHGGKLAVSVGLSHCKDKDCAICFLDGFVGTVSRGIMGKLLAGVDRGFGPMEHGTVSIDAELMKLPFEMIRKRVVEGLKNRGIDAALVVHFRRIDRKNCQLVYSLHFHWAGMVRGGVDTCRNCSFNVVNLDWKGRIRRSWCANESFCLGFEQRTRREYEKDKLIVKVMGKRASGLDEQDSMMKTLRYILSHTGYIAGDKRFQMVTYMGRMANAVLKAKKVKAVHRCPVCAKGGVKNEMRRAVKFTERVIVTDIGSPSFKRVVSCPEFDGALNLPSFVEYKGDDGGGGGYHGRGVRRDG